MLHSQRLGQNLIEAILAIALFGILMSGGVLTSLRYYDNQIRGQAQQTTAQVAQSTFEIIDSLAKTNWATLTNGTHGLIFNNPNWTLSETPDTINNFNRTITITEATRDLNCNLVEVDGTDDSDTKIVELTLSYNDNRGPQTKTFSQIFTNWKTPTNCVVITEAGKLDLDISTAYIDSTKKSLFGIFLRNNGNTIITLDKMTFSWDKPGNITYVKIAGQNYWHSTNGIGTPTGAQPSGTELDLVDFVLQPNTSYEMNTVRFDEKVDGATFSITAKMLDGSTKTEITTPPFIP